ncbi:MAG TPA: glycosyltransferase family 4 protein [Actinomycetota bacterium]|nr:glycosyltransferase family 4 protein [Actinomycetota bacterium]
MKIAQIAPPWIAVPPPGYGGIEWVVALLADELAARGHDVTLFASGGSVTKAKLDSVFDPAPGPTKIGDTYLEVLHAFHAYEHAGDFDVIHDHSGMVGLAIAAHAGIKVVHTVHGPLVDEALRWYRMVTGRVTFVAISDSQMKPGPDLSWAGRVYNGIPVERYPFREDKEDFLLFVGRVNREKGPEVAVEVAKRAGARLVMAVAIKEKFEQEYWDVNVAPALTGNEEILGEITVEEKADLMARARAVLFPIQWEEPFGLVMAEANACGTPVLAFPRGAAPEVIADGETGFLCADVNEMAEAVARVGEIDPHACRARVEKMFSAPAMTAGYEDVYRKVLGG